MQEAQLMYQIIDGEPTQVVRWGDELIPATDDRVNQIPGQGLLFLGGVSYDGREV